MTSDAALAMLLADGLVALLAMAIIGCEIVLARRLAGLAWASFSANAAAGICILGGLYAALSGSGGMVVLGWLAASLVAHAAYLILMRRGR